MGNSTGNARRNSFEITAAFTWRAKLLLVIAALLAVYAGYDYWHRYFPYEITLKTEHFVIYSTATESQTKKIGEVAEMVYTAYASEFKDVPAIKRNTHRLAIKLFGDRKEFQRHNKSTSWAEAFYQEPFCYAYYAEYEANPYHWMLHEVTHQLNNEVGHLKIPKWINEGLATYFSTSTIAGGKMLLGQIDLNTYPVWWLSNLSLSGDIGKDIKERKIIPLRLLISGRSELDMNKHFNTYYVGWWSLTHFLFHYKGGYYSTSYPKLIEDGGSLENFERLVGPVDRIQREWYGYLSEKIRDAKVAKKA